MYSLLHTRRVYHHDPKHPHHHDGNGAVIENKNSGTRRIQVVRNVLDANRMVADQLRHKFAHQKVFVLNVMSSPGSGKTTTLIRTLNRLMPTLRCANLWRS